MEQTASETTAHNTSSLSQQQQVLFAQALQVVQSENINITEDDLLRIVTQAADLGEGYYNIGLAFLQHNQFIQAKDYLLEACRLTPTACESFFQLARCYHQLGELDDAITYYQNALTIEPKHAESLAYLSLSYYQQNELDLAQKSTVNWIHAYPTLAPAYNLLGCIYLSRQQYQEAISQFNHALQFDVTYYEAIVNLGQAHTYLYHYHEADNYLKRALAINSNSSTVYTYYGINALNQRQFKLAQHSFEKAIEFDEENALAYANLSVALQYRYCFGSGNVAMRQALTLDNTQADFYVHFAGNLLLQNHPQKAVKSYQRALQLSTSHLVVSNVLSDALLSIGEYQTGWQQRSEYQRHNAAIDYDYPRWQGGVFPGKVLLVYVDTEIEEAILLLRYIPLLTQYGRRIVVTSPVRLLPLLEKMEEVEKVWLLSTDLTKIMPIDLQVALSTLPTVFDTTVDTIPDQFPYLPVNPDQLHTWENMLQRYPSQKYKIGLSWERAALPNPAQDVPFSVFATIAKHVEQGAMFNITPYQNQKQYQVGEKLGLHDIGTRDIEILCAVIQKMDVVMTADNTVAHIAGALNKPVYLILPFAAKWYWLNDSDVPLWYPSICLFRQTVPNQWHDVITNVLKNLRQDYL